MPDIATGAKWVSSKLWNEIKAALAASSHLVIYDLETTGLSSSKNQIIEIGAIRYRVRGLKLEEEEVLHYHFNPGCRLPDGIVALTGLTDSFLADKPSEGEHFREVAAFFEGVSVSGYNVGFDNRFMKELFVRHSAVFSPQAIIDVIKMARELIAREEVANYKLETIGPYCGLTFKAHSALEDARATAELFMRFLKEYRKREKASEVSPGGTTRPEISMVEYWAGRRGYSRIYVETSAGTVYYDLRGHRWGNKDADISDLDMDWLESEAWRLTGCRDETEFCSFKEVLKVA